MYKLILFTILFISSAQVWATDFIVPKQVIIGAEKPYPPGEAIILKVSPIESVPNYLTDIKYQWTILNSDGSVKYNVIVWPDNTSVFFGAGIRKNNFTAVLSITYLYIVKNDKDIVTEVCLKTASLLVAKIIVEGMNPEPEPGPNPGPGPGPNPAPDPIFPTGQFELAKFSYNNTKLVNLPTADKIKSSRAISNSLRGIVSAIGAGTVTDLKDALQKSSMATDNALLGVGISKQFWSEFGSKLQDRLYELYTGGKMTTLANYKVALEEIIQGLDAVR